MPPKDRPDRYPISVRLELEQHDWLRWFGYRHRLSLDASVRRLIDERKAVDPAPADFDRNDAAEVGL